MQDDKLSREELLAELYELRRRVNELEDQEARTRRWVELVQRVNALKEDLLAHGSLHEKLKRITDGLVKIFGADFARIWVMKPGDRCSSDCVHAKVTEGPHVCHQRNLCLHLTASSGRYTHIDGELHRRVPFDCYKIGRIASGAVPKFLTNDVANDPRIHDQTWARELGLVSFAGYRLLSEDSKPIGVMALFSKQFISPDEEAMLEGLANTTSHVVQTAVAEEAWRQSEYRCRSLVETSPDPIIVYDLEGNLITVNQQAAAAYGVDSSEQLLTEVKKVSDILDDESRKKAAANLGRILESGSSRKNEYTIIRKDGSTLQVEINSSMVRNADGAAVAFISVVRDITDRKRAEQRIRESEERLRLAWDTVPDALSISRLQDGAYVDVNTGYTFLTGYTREEVAGKSSLNLPFWDDPSERQPFVDAVTQHGHVWNYRTRLRRKDGETRAILISAGLMMLEGEKHVLAVTKDIEDLIRTQEALSETEARYKRLVETTDTGFLELDSSGKVLQANDPYARMAGFSKAEELIGRSVLDWTAPECLSDNDATVQLCVRQGHISDFETTYLRADGSRVRILIDATTEDSPEGRKIVTLCRDITERKRMETVLRESEQMFRLLSEQSLMSVAILQDGVYHYANDAMSTLTEYSVDEILSWGPGEFLTAAHPDDRDLVLQQARMKQEGLPDQTPRYSFRVITKSGANKWVDIYSKTVQFKGRSANLLTMLDITERKKSEEALEKSQAMLTSILNSVPQSVFWKDLNSVYLGCNEEFARTVGLESTDEIVGKTDYDLPWARNEADAYRADDHEVMSLNQPKRHIVEPLQQADGTRIWIDTTKIPITEENGTVYGILGVYEDITERKKTEDAIRGIVEGVSGEIGEKFFESTVLHFAKILHADLTLIGEILHGDHGAVVRTIAFSSGGELRDNYEYDLKGAPCENVTKKGICSYPRRVSELFPKDKALARMNIESYVGVCLYNSRGIPIGIMAAMYLQPLDNVEFAESVLRIFASRAAAEIERNKAEEALRDSEATLRTLLQAAPIGIGQVSADRTLGWTNQLLGTMLGYSMEELAGQSARILYESEEEFLRVGREKHLDVVRYGTGSVETRFRRKDGTAFDVLLSSSSVHPGDISHGMVFTAIDITERKASEQQLQRLGAAVESAGETIVVTDSAGSIIYVNPAFEGITGYSRQEALGQNPRILKSGKHDRAFYRGMWDTLLKGQVWRGRFTNRRKDGTLYEETATISPIKDESGRISNYVAVKRDVTGETMLQNQLLHAQKMEAIGTLAGGMAHDFNNLLQAILGYSDLLHMKKAPDDPDRRKLEVIQQAARDGADLVARILTFSRKGESKTRPIDLNEEIRKAQKLLRRTVPRMIEIELVLAENLQIIDADPAQVEQILLNLAVNAQHAMPDGGQLLIETSNVSLSNEYLRTHLGTQPGHYVLLTVSDTGVGIEPEVMDRIFEPFFTTKTNGEGTGLGLSMVHGIVAQHGGHIRCYSEPGRGTSFKIYFPVSAGELMPDLALTREMPAFGTETVLLVDDDDRIREMGRLMIEKGGYKVLLASSGEEALEIYAAKRAEISLVILDLNMPGMGGKRCLEEILGIDPLAKVIVASGYSPNGLTLDEKGNGARGFVSKPYDAKDILTAIRKVLDKGRL